MAATLPFPRENGFHTLLGDLEEAATFGAARAEAAVRAFWEECMNLLRATAKYLQTEVDHIRAEGIWTESEASCPTVRKAPRYAQH